MPSFEKEFRESKGQPIGYCENTIIRMDRIKVGKVFSGYIELISTNSDWLQGVILDVNGELEINTIKGQKFILWQNHMKKPTFFHGTSKDKQLLVWTAWDTGNGVTNY